MRLVPTSVNKVEAARYTVLRAGVKRNDSQIGRTTQLDQAMEAMRCLSVWQGIDDGWGRWGTEWPSRRQPAFTAGVRDTKRWNC